MWDYDVVNCHYTIAQRLCRELGISCEVIDDYCDLTQTDKLRHDLAERVGISPGAAKTCLLAVLYGAKLNAVRPRSAIRQEIGVAAAERLFRDEWFLSLVAEVRRIAQEIIAGWRNRTPQFLVNRVGKGIKQSVRSNTKKFAHLLQGEEAFILRGIVDHYGDAIALTQHDGFTAYQQLDVAELERVVERKAGYPLAMKETQPRAVEVAQHYKLSKMSGPMKNPEPEAFMTAVNSHSSTRPTVHTYALGNPPPVDARRGGALGARRTPRTAGSASQRQAFETGRTLRAAKCKQVAGPYPASALARAV
jgi:hypothetical protein